MKKLFLLIISLFMAMFCLAGCDEGEIYASNLEHIEVTSYVKEEETVKLIGAKIFFCIFGSYTHETNHEIMQRYIFLAQNGPRDSYKINDIHVYSNNNTSCNCIRSHVYFIYTQEGETPYLEYQKKEIMENENNYWLHLPRTSVLEIANDMFKDM